MVKGQGGQLPPCVLAPLARGQLKYYASLVLCSPKQVRKMAHFSPDFQEISKKKRSSPKSKQFFCPNSGDLQKKSLRCFISMPLQAHGPRGHCSPLPPSRRPCNEFIASGQHNFCQINITAMVTRGQHCVRFDELKTRTTNLMFLRRILAIQKILEKNIYIT